MLIFNPTYTVQVTMDDREGMHYGVSLIFFEHWDGGIDPQ